MSQAIIDAVLMTNGVGTARRVLASRGIAVSDNALRDRIRYLIDTGQRGHLHPGRQEKGEDHSEFDALNGSRKLLRAQIRAGQVFPDAMARWEARHGRSQVAA